MKIDRNITNLICELEYIVGNQTYNPNSYNGWTGVGGCNYKYPVSFCENKKALEERKLSKSKVKIEHIDKECIKTMKYAFGSNHLYIGDGIAKLLEFLENRYDINFNELEQARRNVKMIEFVAKLENKGIVTLTKGTWEIGVDIPEGEYRVLISNRCWVEIFDETEKEVNEIIGSGDYINMKLEKGYFIKVPYSCLLEK